ncbi:MAG: hypothetical protein LBN10_07715 [Propionibacteriaceae bacterium]|jgi:N,N'-diacetylchitobiose phosphorylase|nr:hypothetical protein [Propionibacteriaceae bacterium]
MKYGHFDTEHDEYVVDRVDLPASWINYIGVENWCTVLNQNAGGYSFYRSSQQGRVTRFRPNSVPLDRPGHYLYLRDDSDGDYWSASWQPVGKPLADPLSSAVAGEARYRTRHGLSYSVFESSYKGIDASQRVFVPRGEDVELWDVQVTNTTDRPREISLYGYVEFSFHSIQIDNENFQMSLYASGSDYADGVVEYDFYYEPWTYHYFTSTQSPDGFDSMRDSFIGPYRTESNPIAVERGEMGSSQATTQNHCGALQHRLTLAPGQSARLVYLLGYGNREVATRVRAKYSDLAEVDRAIEDLAHYWQAKKDVYACQTPSEAMNALINTWTLYQAETCVVWSRFASFVEVGGRVGLGFRDTAQDVMSVIHTNPDKTRARMEELLHGQMSPGYGLHLFDPLLFDENKRDDIPVGVKLPTVVPGSASDLVHGLADACSDDHLWLVPSVVEYVVETGDVAFLNQVMPFADSDLADEARDKVLGADYAKRFDKAPATVLDHLMRAIEFSADQVGDNGIAKGLRADWNDCLNLGGGQTALVTFLHVWAAKSLRDLLAVQKNMGSCIARLDEIIATVTEAANRELWDGEWYIRGYTRDGVKIGSKDSPEGKIFLEHMPWSIIAGIADAERGESSMDAVHERLASPYGTHLCWPSYTQVDDTIGYVTRVYPGVKENGAIFSHPNAWPVIAETILGRGDKAISLYNAMAPFLQNDMAELRGAEPYVYAQFIYGRDHEFYGKAQNPWLTGTAGWMYTAATKWILGVRPTMKGLVIDPCIPTDWDGFQVTRQWRGATYNIEVHNPHHVSAGVAEVEVTDKTTGPGSLPLVPRETDGPYKHRHHALVPVGAPGHTYKVVITLG